MLHRAVLNPREVMFIHFVTKRRRQRSFHVTWCHVSSFEEWSAHGVSDLSCVFCPLPCQCQLSMSILYINITQSHRSIFTALSVLSNGWRSPSLSSCQSQFAAATTQDGRLTLTSPGKRHQCINTVISASTENLSVPALSLLSGPSSNDDYLGHFKKFWLIHRLIDWLFGWLIAL